jgi:hypothetical protein
VALFRRPDVFGPFIANLIRGGSFSFARVLEELDPVRRIQPELHAVFCRWR